MTTLLLLAGAAVMAIALLIARPRWGILLAVFLLFTNLPVVAAQDGRVPAAAGALVGLLFLPALAHHLIANREMVRVDRTFALLLAYLASLLVSAFVAVDPGLAWERIGVFAMEGLLIYLLVVNTVRDLPALRSVVTVLILAAALLAGLTALQAASGYDQDFGGLARLHPEVEAGLVNPTQGPRAENRARGPVDDPNRFAQILLLVAPLAFIRFLNARDGGAGTGAGTGRETNRGAREHREPALSRGSVAGRSAVEGSVASRRTRFLAGGACLLILGGVLMTYSRGAFLTLAVLVGLLGVLGYVRPSRLAVGALAAMLMVPVLMPGYVERIRSIAGVAGLFTQDAPVEPDAVTRGRTTEMLAALLAFREHPVVGVGPGQYMPYHSVQYQLRPEISFRELPTPRRAHDLYVEIAAETGMPGLLIFLAVPALLLLDLQRLRVRLSRERPDLDRIAGGFMLAVLGYLGTGVFLHLAYERYYWFFIGLTGAAVAVLRRELPAERAT